MFWRTIKSRFQIKARLQTIISTERHTIMKNEKLIANIFNNYFSEITKTLILKIYRNCDGQSLSSITEYFKNNESVIKIKSKKSKRTHFHLLCFQGRAFLKR